MIEKSIENEKKGAHVSAGSYAVCVRTCDGSFFPVSYSGAGSRSDSLEEVCRSLCPNADMQLYSFPFGGTIDQAVSSTGEPYVNMPNALKFQQSVDSTCSCRRKGQSWAQALAAAEAKYGHELRDILVTPEKSAELSRPIISKVAADPKGKPAKTNAKATGQPTDAAAPQAGVAVLAARRAPAAARRAFALDPRRNSRPRRQRGRHGAQRRGGDGQPRGLRHRRRRRSERERLRERRRPDGHRNRSGRRQPEGADSRANALARPISGNSAASSGPASRPVSASRSG